MSWGSKEHVWDLSPYKPEPAFETVKWALNKLLRSARRSSAIILYRKSKALAQRKFAQGAYIPPANTTSTTPERRSEPQPSTSRDTTNVVLSNVSAKILLDNVSLKGPLQTSLLPKVLLDRLPTANMPKRKVPCRSPSKRITRSKAKKLINVKKEVKPKKQILKRRVSNSSDKQNNNESNDFNAIEDNTPLTHLLKNTDQKPANMAVCGIVKAEQPVSSMEIESNIAQNEPDVNTSSYYSHQEIQKWLADSISEEDVTEEVSAEVTEEVSAEVTEEVSAEVTEEVSAEVTEEVSAEVTGEEFEEISKDLPAEASQENPQQADETEALNNDNCNCTNSSEILNITLPENRGEHVGRHKCEKCRFVDKMKTLTNLVSRVYDTPPIVTSVPYNIGDSNTNEVDKRPELIRTNDQPSKSVELSMNKGNLYMDVSQHLGQIIQISADKNGIMHAKLVPRTQAYPTNEFSFIENENLLDQVLTSLKASNSQLLQGSLIQLQDSSKNQMDPPLVPVNDNLNDNHSESSHSSQNMKLLYMSESSENVDVDDGRPPSHAGFTLEPINLNPTSEFPIDSDSFLNNRDVSEHYAIMPDSHKEQQDIAMPDSHNEPQDIAMPDTHNGQQDITVPDSHNEPQDIAMPDTHNGQQDITVPDSHNEPQDIAMPDTHNGQQDITVPDNHNEPQDIAMPDTHNGQQDITVPDSHNEPQDIAMPDTHNGQQDITVPDSHNEPQDIAMPDTHNGQQDITVPDSHNEPQDIAMQDTHNGQKDITMPDSHNEPQDIAMPETHNGQKDITVPDSHNEPQDIAMPDTHKGQQDITVPDSHNEPQDIAMPDTHNGQQDITVPDSHNEPQDIAMPDTHNGQEKDITMSDSHIEQQTMATTSHYKIITEIIKPESPLTLSDDDSVIECTENDYIGVEVRSVARSRYTATPFSLPSTSKCVALKDCPKAIEAPVFYPTNQDFQNPIAYFEKILPEASKFGLCKVVSPRDFKPPCSINNEIRFKVVNQYIARLFSRWGPASRKMCAFRAHLASEKVKFTRAPLVDGMEVNLPKLYNLVQHHGGVVRILTKKLWGRIAEEMAVQRHSKPNKKIEQVYLKCLLPYQMLSEAERQNITHRLEIAWSKKNRKMMKRATNPLHRKNRLLGDSESSEEDTEEKDLIEEALAESEDCVVPGRTMSLSSYKKIAKSTMSVLFPKSSSVIPLTKNIEAEYWRFVSQGNDHLCINTASIDTGAEGYGFTKEQSDEYSKHPWNLKMLSQNSDNVLRFLGSVLGVTVPTLHLGMVFSTSCWHRDPHGLPWIEYMHEGPGKIWYGIPNEQSSAFCKAVSDLCPTVCQNKSVWLPSDVAMIPPNLLLKHNVSLSRVEQHPGEFIIVFPKAYSCSISTGYTVSESVYFATVSWLDDVHQLFNDLKNCCEPTMFSLEKLLVAVARDERAPVNQLNKVRRSLVPLIQEELNYRNELKEKVNGLKIMNESRYNKRPRFRGGWNSQEQDECEICRSTLFFAKVMGLTANSTFVCLEHAIKLVNRTRPVTNQVTLITKISDQELETLVKSVEKRTASCK